MNLHWACDNDIHPALFGATQRLFGLARGAATRAHVKALCVVPNRSRGARLETLAGVELHRVKSWHTSVAWWLERGGLAPLFTAHAGHSARANAYRRELGAAPDALLCDLTLTGMFAGAGHALRVYHAHNVEAQRWQSAAPRVFARDAWGGRLAALERRAVQEADACIACSDEDAELLRTLHGARDVEVIATGFDETALGPVTPESRRAARAALGIPEGAYVLAFVGGDWGPNHAALAWLVEHVMPALAGEGFVLLAVGAVARRHTGRTEPWLVARSETPDLTAVLAAADAGMNPVTTGGGSNVKVPTYLALGLAVISTPFGVRGYAPLAPHVTVAALEHTADVLRTRPRGWAARAEAAPAALSDYAWSALGARLAGSLATRIESYRKGAA
ncbi:MAG: glycosyltransferase [Candidatus Eisenbacteria bacterium]